MTAFTMPLNNWENTIASILPTPVVQLNHMLLQCKSGSCSDCGSYAIAFATAAVSGGKPGLFLPDHSKMK